ncbi:BON domain-containing protein [Flavihumibacter sp. UBA7668]|uniref:BON domain-containing protein n=1 Tax=Flavihumibacter sp. UBA7668 TaxID=1946542 RepID=UPI0025BAB3C8|nr:BON domain-containing protein [Flavihumibacter sp. UBA7668]
MNRISRLLWALFLVGLVAFTGCKPKDADIEKSLATALGAYPGVQVSVKDGIATLNGEVADEATRSAAETAAKGVKGVKSVSSNLTIPPPPAPVVINPDTTLQETANAAISSLSLSKVQAAVQDGVITLTGEIKKADLQGLMVKLNELKPKKIENKLTIK